MKTISASLLALAILASAGCFSYERRTTPVVVESGPVVGTERVVTVLPTGSKTRVYRGTTYYYYGETVYRTAPGGYVVTTRPW